MTSYTWVKVKRGARHEHLLVLVGGYGNRVRVSVWPEKKRAHWVMHSFSAQRDIASGTAATIKDAKAYAEALAHAMGAEDWP